MKKEHDSVQIIRSFNTCEGPKLASCKLTKTELHNLLVSLDHAALGNIPEDVRKRRQKLLSKLRSALQM